jgi:hypothetical protein
MFGWMFHPKTKNTLSLKFQKGFESGKTLGTNRQGRCDERQNG